MRLAVFALCALVGASAAGSAFAGGAHEPPDPCLQMHTTRARHACELRHPRPMDHASHFGDGSVHFRSGAGQTQR